MSLTESKLAEIEARLHPLLEREKRAREIRQLVPPSRFFMGLTGIAYRGEPFDILPGFLTLRSVTNPPGMVHVCRAADLHRTDYLAIARYSLGVSAELAVGNSDCEGHSEPDFLHNIAWHTAALLKLRGHDLLSCPASSTASWDTVAAIDNQSVHFRVLDDVPRQVALIVGESTVTTADLTWVRDNWDSALRLRDASSSRRFGLAFNIAYTWNHTQEVRIAIGNLWCGLDALFGLQTDRPVTQKLVERIAAWLSDSSEEQIHDLYDHRCDAIHGRWMKDDELGMVLRGTKSLLFRSLVRCIEEGAITLPDWGS